jgi:hypothetical protein
MLSTCLPRAAAESDEQGSVSPGMPILQEGADPGIRTATFALG